MPRPSGALLVARLERIEQLAHDLAREVARNHEQTVAARSLADAIKHDIDAVLRALKKPIRY